MKSKNLFIILLLGIVGFILLKPILLEKIETGVINDEPKQGLVLAASREGALGIVALQLYEDKSFEVWTSSLMTTTLTTKGEYEVASDTLILEVQHEKVTSKNSPKIRYLISDGMLITIPKGTGLVFLGVTLNKLNTSPPPDIK